MEDLAFKSVRISDLTGNELKDEDVITVTIKGVGKVFDASAEEMSGLKRIANAIELEYKHPDGSSETVLVTQNELNKILPPEKVDTLDSARGRRTGFSPRQSKG
ncbi:hypothetical protein G3I13_01735 [Streptomyces sp. SID6673]|nr:hypothetical protein [Streptomyces sp. SID11726]NDZ94882.1 hypothetical protein [Streptomyces sp. SID11726]NEB23042.1 hypothetical protein [Streptomyces sp. SID6673]